MYLDENLVFAFAHMKWKRLGTEASVHHVGADLPLTEKTEISEVKKKKLAQYCLS